MCIKIGVVEIKIKGVYIDRTIAVSNYIGAGRSKCK